MRVLINAGDNPHQIMSDGASLLHYANKPEIYQLLLKEYKLNPNQKMINGGTPIHFVYSIQAITALLAHGAEVDSLNCRGKPRLVSFCHSVSDLHADIIITLLEHGANPNHSAYEKNEKPFVLFANATMNKELSEEKRKKIFDLFLKKGAKSLTWERKHTYTEGGFHIYIKSTEFIYVEKEDCVVM